MVAVTSWFVDQTNAPATEPDMTFLIGTSDYSDRVIKWPKIKRESESVKFSSVAVAVDNVDGHFNGFYTNVYTIPNTCTLKIGFTHPNSNAELLTVFTGFLEDVRYSKKQCLLKMKDRLTDMGDRKVGDSASPVTFANTIPSEIAWVLCTSYGELSTTKSSANPDIDYTEFQIWAETFSKDTVICGANYEGMKVSKALTSIAEMTGSMIWVGGDGKIIFKRYVDVSSNETLITDPIDLRIDVEGKRLANRQSVHFDYAVESNYWQKLIVQENSVSVSSYGLYDDLKEDENIWYVDSVSALGFAQRRLGIYREPPKRFEVDTQLSGVFRDMGESIRLVDSFFGITSADIWRITEHELDMQTGEMYFELDGAFSGSPFTLDVSKLDGSDLLL